MFGGTNSATSEFATLVLGQSNFQNTSNNAGASGSNATANSLSKPRSVFFDGTKLYVADTSNNRILIWNSAPSANKQDADIVIGQADKTITSSNRSSTAAANTLSFPRSVFVNSSKLFIADTGNNRILVYDSIPTSDGASANRVIGHANFTESEGNRLDSATSGVRRDTLNEPTDIFYDGSKLFVADSGNHRVLIYDGLSSNSEEADTVVGQIDMTKAALLSPTANTLNKPTHIYVTSNDRLLISDSGNNRILIFHSIPSSNNSSANVVIGQASFTTSASGTSNSTLSNPQDIYADGDETLTIADTGNHRILIYDSVPGSNGAAAHQFLGQPNFTSSQANRGDEPDGSTLNAPHGVFTNGVILWIADTENHRVLRFPGN